VVRPVLVQERFRGWRRSGFLQLFEGFCDVFFIQTLEHGSLLQKSWNILGLELVSQIMEDCSIMNIANNVMPIDTNLALDQSHDNIVEGNQAVENLQI
jgi:hypothetical protein